ARRADTHPFPTRRSSDLGLGGATAQIISPGEGVLQSGGASARDREHGAKGGERGNLRPRSLPLAHVHSPGAPCSARRRPRVARGDRKSTRLNSSHVKISY